MGFLNIRSSDDIILVSTSCTSPVIRAIISPFRSSVKKPKGRLTILLYNWLRISRTTPVRIGTTLEDARKYAKVFSIVDKDILETTLAPLHQRGNYYLITRLKQNLQDRYQCCKRENIEQSRQDIENYRKRHIFLVWRHKPPQHLHKIFHTTI